MKAYKESILSNEDTFPVEIFVRDNLEEEVRVASHWHDCVEVLCFLEGRALQQINECVFEVKANDVVVVNYGVIHSTKCEKNQACKVLVLKFMPQLINESVSFIDSKYIHMFLSNSTDYKYYIENIVTKDSKLHRIFETLLNEYTVRGKAYEIIIKGYIYQIIGMLIRNGNIDIMTQEIDKDLYDEMKPVINYLEQNYMKPIHMKAVAKMNNMSYSYFSRNFKKAIGRNFKEFLDCVRIFEADKLMVSTSMNIATIAYEVGYNNVSSFNRVYKRVKGTVPSTMKQFRVH